MEKKELAILKKGKTAWNKWREENKEIQLNLGLADLRGAKLTGVNLSGASLMMAKLSGANLSGANLRGANLNWADLINADLIKADLSEADLLGAGLRSAKLGGANLNGANLSGATIGHTIFADVDLSQTKGLESVLHMGPSTIGVDTIYKSRGKIPENFLRNCGLPADFISYIDSFIAGKAIQFYSAFISYSSKDELFAKRLHADLQANKVRVWFAPEDMKYGAIIRDSIDQAINVYDKLIVVLSETSVASDWVQDEVEAAYEKERKELRIVLFPIRIDEAVMVTDKGWAAKIRRARNIGDFTMWNNPFIYQERINRLLRDLQAENRKP